MEEIVSVSDERISAYHSLKEYSDRTGSEGDILVEGPEALGVLLKSEHEIRNVFLEPEYFKAFAALIAARAGLSERCYLAERNLMSKIVGYRLHRGVMAIAARPKPKPLSELSFPIVAFNGLADAENVGSIVRTAHAFGVSSFLVDKRSADPYLRRAIRVSMGAALASKIAYVDSLAESASQFTPSVELVAIEQTSDATPLAEARFSKRSIFVFGKEKGGIESSVLSRSSARINIPMETDVVKSLNVAHAAAIVLARLNENS